MACAVLIAVAVTRWAVLASVDGEGGHAPSINFRGTIVSLYSDGTGGCVKAAPGQGLPVASDAHCGPMFLGPGAALAIGRTVEATSIDSITPSGEAVQGYLIGALDG